jgi:hypothetical protein
MSGRQLGTFVTPITRPEYLRCEGCHRLDCVTAPSTMAAIEVLKREGWRVVGTALLCPVCVTIPWRLAWYQP